MSDEKFMLPEGITMQVTWNDLEIKPLEARTGLSPDDVPDDNYRGPCVYATPAAWRKLIAMVERHLAETQPGEDEWVVVEFTGDVE